MQNKFPCLGTTKYNGYQPFLIINPLKKILPDLDIHFGGSSALGLPGQNDIDLDILSSPADYEKYTPLIEKLFGAPEKHASYIEWKFDKNGFEVELCLTDRNSLSMKEQIKIYQILSNNKDLAEEYRNIKLPYGRINFKEYTKKKYAFFNKVLEN